MNLKDINVDVVAAVKYADCLIKRLAEIPPPLTPPKDEKKP